MLVKTDKWAASVNGEMYCELDAKTSDEAIKEVQKGGLFNEEDLTDEYGNKRFWLGKVCKYEPVIDPYYILERLGSDCYEDIGDSGIGYLEYVSREAEDNLKERLTKVYKEWEIENNLDCKNFTVEEAQLILIRFSGK